MIVVGIDIFIFKFYFIRSVVIFVVKVVDVFLDEIMVIVGWCLSFVFVVFYNKLLLFDKFFVSSVFGKVQWYMLNIYYV